MEVRKEQLTAIMPKCRGSVGKYLPVLNRYAAAFGVDTPLRMAHFLAQVAHESAEMTAVVENMNYTAGRLLQVFPSLFRSGNSASRYAGKPEATANLVYRGKLGNRLPGDGWKFRGRGLLHLTGRTNYENYQRYLNRNGMDVDLTVNPELLSAPLGAVKSALWFWYIMGCNTMADGDDVKAVSRRICGSMEGVVSRASYLVKAKKAFGL